MKKLLFAALFLLTISFSHSQWVSNFGDKGGDVNFSSAKGNAVTTDSYGNSYVTGYTYEAATLNDIVTIKYNSQGDTLWARSYNGTANRNDEGTGIYVDAYGNVYVVGFAEFSSKATDVVVLKYSPEGNLLWNLPYAKTSDPLIDKGLAIAADMNGFIYVTGYTTNYDGEKDIFVNKYSSAGLIWTSELEDGGTGLDAEGLSIAVSRSGSIYVAGYITSAASSEDIVVIKYNNAGEKQWMRPVNGNVNQSDKAWGIVVDELDNCFITGYITNSVGNADCYTAKINYAGTIVWSTTYAGEGNQTDKAWGIVVDTDGAVYITGETTDAYSNVNYVTIKYSAYSAELWKSFYNGTGNGEDVASSIGLVGSNSVVVTGKSWGTSDTYDYATVRYNTSTGTQNQVNIYSFTGTSYDIAMDIAVTPTNKVIITGFSELVIDNAVNMSYMSTTSLDFSSELTTANNTPVSYSLHQNYPNPFNPSTTIKFDLAAGNNVKLAVYDMLGRENSVLVNQYLSAGSYTINFTNSNLASGIYFYRLTAGSFTDIKKMTLVK
ncbi:MAG TPA: SBBP repeat-containing protein [Ignavibacteria bacterium]|nr:SBBP repeat-containing protein [Ignavibacteria bacterium]